jgi:hypothetical protein
MKYRSLYISKSGAPCGWCWQCHCSVTISCCNLPSGLIARPRWACSLDERSWFGPVSSTCVLSVWWQVVKRVQRPAAPHSLLVQPGRLHGRALRGRRVRCASLHTGLLLQHDALLLPAPALFSWLLCWARALAVALHRTRAERRQVHLLRNYVLCGRATVQSPTASWPDRGRPRCVLQGRGASARAPAT